MTLLTVAGRAERLLTALDERGLDQMIVSDRSNIRWLSGFTGSAGVLLISARGHVLITDGRYTNQAREQLDHAGASSIEVRTCRTLSAQRRVLAEIVSGRIVGAEATVMSHDGWAACSADNELLPVDGVVGQLRRAKDEAEIALIACAAEIATKALHSIGHLLIPGVSEREIRDELEYTMRKLGADGPSYETIVASGPTNAALPHARPTSRQLAVGDTVVIDVGALVDGYHSDMTRSFVIGDPTDEQQHWYQLVRESQLAGLAAVAAGVNVRDIDRACRAVFEGADCADLYVHGTGHGVGLDIHEEPFLGASGDLELV
ncbi:MAG: Xaa-Pro peptidase family protein, partial [Actinomycetota bacterium]|nr:Xaa-Pro peptidase family protein [Actinomycetota bacterium]